MSKLVKNLLIGFGILTIVLCIVGGIFFYNVSIDKEELQLRQTVMSQQQKCGAFYDKMWKVLQQQAGVAEEYKNSFKEVYSNIITGRYADKPQLLMQWVQEKNPQFDPSMFQSLMRQISIEREGFLQEQNKLIELNQQHLLFINPVNQPTSWFLNATQQTPVGIMIVTSTKTEEVMKTGKDDDVQLFNRK